MWTCVHRAVRACLPVHVLACVFWEDLSRTFDVQVGLRGQYGNLRTRVRRLGECLWSESAGSQQTELTVWPSAQPRHPKVKSAKDCVHMLLLCRGD